VPRVNVVASAAHSIAVRITANENRLASIIDAIDWNDLAIVISK
jgi:hypothetical protein